MKKFSKFVVTAFALAILVATLPGCQKQEGPAEHAGDASTQAYPPAQANTSSPRKCAECGVIDSIREVTTKGEGSGLGVVGGAIVGGLLGNQVGAGSGKDVATVAGAVGGAVAGNQIEKSVKSTRSYDITVRFEDGSSRVFHEANAPAWRPGDRVKVINDVIRANG
jgi:outer membrane lipoprotein SlyB